LVLAAKVGLLETALAGEADGEVVLFVVAGAFGGHVPPDAVEWSSATEQPEETEPLSAMESPELTERWWPGRSPSTRCGVGGAAARLVRRR